jgi:hypothetical protein
MCSSWWYAGQGARANKVFLQGAYPVVSTDRTCLTYSARWIDPCKRGAEEGLRVHNDLLDSQPPLILLKGVAEDGQPS